MYLSKTKAKEIASLINTIDVCEIGMAQARLAQDWNRATSNRKERNYAIVELAETYHIPHALYATAKDWLESNV